MNARTKILKHFNLPEEKRRDIIIHRIGGWLEDTQNPKIWPGEDENLKMEDFDPVFPTKSATFYVEFSIRNGDRIPPATHIEFPGEDCLE